VQVYRNNTGILVYYMGIVVVNGCTCTGLVKRYGGIRLVQVHTGAIVVQLHGYRSNKGVHE